MPYLRSSQIWVSTCPQCGWAEHQSNEHTPPAQLCPECSTEEEREQHEQALKNLRKGEDL